MVTGASHMLMGDLRGGGACSPRLLVGMQSAAAGMVSSGAAKRRRERRLRADGRHLAWLYSRIQAVAVHHSCFGGRAHTTDLVQGHFDADELDLDLTLHSLPISPSETRLDVADVIDDQAAPDGPEPGAAPVAEAASDVKHAGSRDGSIGRRCISAMVGPSASPRESTSGHSAVMGRPRPSRLRRLRKINESVDDTPYTPAFPDGYGTDNRLLKCRWKLKSLWEHSKHSRKLRAGWYNFCCDCDCSRCFFIYGPPDS